jgi:hypothetical protein
VSVSPRTQVLADLANHPGWKELSAIVMEQKASYFQSLGAALYNDPRSVTETDLHFKRGFFKGMVWLLANPVVEVKKLQQELDKEGDSA